MPGCCEVLLKSGLGGNETQPPRGNTRVSPRQAVQGSCLERGVAESLQRSLPLSPCLALLSTGVLWLCRSYSNNLFHSKPLLALSRNMLDKESPLHWSPRGEGDSISRNLHQAKLQQQDKGKLLFTQPGALGNDQCAATQHSKPHLLPPVQCLLNNCTHPGRLSCCLSFNIPV